MPNTRVDFRLIAATNRNLDEMITKWEFRSDLYYRLPIRIPPLRERPVDIPLLVRYFVQRFAKRLRRPIESVARESMDMLCRWPWPGNVRELQNVLERAVILSHGPTLTVPRADFDTAAPASRAITLRDVEREHILRILDQMGWVIGGSHGAAARGWPQADVVRLDDAAPGDCAPSRMTPGPATDPTRANQRGRSVHPDNARADHHKSRAFRIFSETNGVSDNKVGPACRVPVRADRVCPRGVNGILRE